MKKVLCFGDSNTYGFVPGNGKRYAKNTRWTGVLQVLLGSEYKIIEAGYNGRTGFVDSGLYETTGYKVLPKYLSVDLDFVIISIGLNDLQIFYQLSDEDISVGIESYISMIRDLSPNAKIILAAPSEINQNILNSHFSTMFDETAIQRSSAFASLYQNCANVHNCDFIDLNKVANASVIDGLHYTSDAHLTIGHTISTLIKNIT